MEGGDIELISDQLHLLLRIGGEPVAGCRKNWIVAGNADVVLQNKTRAALGEEATGERIDNIGQQVKAFLIASIAQVDNAKRTGRSGDLNGLSGREAVRNRDDADIQAGRQR